MDFNPSVLYKTGRPWWKGEEEDERKHDDKEYDDDIGPGTSDFFWNYDGGD
jgi:hypothetical protein